MLTEEQIRDELLASLSTILGDTGEITEDENLLTRGLESLPAMRLLAVWIKQGYRVSFGSFMRKPTVREWAAMLADAAPSNTESSSVEGGAVEPSLPSGDSEPFDLTDVQYAYWIGREPTQQFGGVGTHGYVEIETTGLDLPRFQHSWTVMLQSHPMLRSCYTDDGKQYVLPEPPDPSIEVHDLTHLRGRACEEAICITRERLSHRLLDIAEGRVACLQVSRLPEGRAIIHFDIDLLVCDVQSFQIILRDLAHHYATGEAPDVDPSWSFARHLAMHAHSDAIDLERDQTYWRGRLPELPSGPRLPLRKGAGTGGSPRFTRRSHEFDAHAWARLRDVCEHHGTTPAMVLLTAYGRTIGQWSENKEFLIAVPVFNRDSDPEIENVVADFTTLTLTSIDQSRPRSFEEDLQSIQDSFYRDLAHSRYSAVRVLRDLRVQRGEQVLAPVVFSCNLGSPLVDEEFVEAFGQIGYMISQTPQVWMDLQVFTTLGGFVIICDAVEQMFPTGMLDDFFGALVDEITSALSGDLSQHGPVDSPGALARRRARAEVPTWRLPGTTLVEQVLSAGTRHPEAVAVTTSEGVPLTYRELVTAARAIATSLAAAGVTRGCLTAVMVERGPRQIVAALGVMMAGGAYVPISRQQPRERVATMLASGRTTHLLTDAGIEEWAEAPVRFVDFTRASSGSDGQTLPEIRPEDSAYVIYTSGTTGTPKGVEVSHGATWNTISEVNRRIDIGPGDRVLGVSSFDFDLSVYDVFGVLSVGAELVTLPDVARRDADTWLSLVQGANITVWNSVPTLFEMLLATAVGAGEKLASLRVVILSGDWIDVGLPERMRAAVPSAHLFAMGGATEAAIWSNALAVEDLPAEWTAIPYGRALERQAYRVVGPDGRDCPNDAVGELWIGGLGVAKGYVDDPELTSEKFVSSEGSRWYRTGDMGRFWHDGTIEFLGRRDNQVKIRGHRIELGEVEAACEAVLPVERAICVAHALGASTSLIVFVRLSEDASFRIASHDLSRGVERLLEDPERRAAVEEDEALQSFYALETMHRWEDELRRRRTPEHLCRRRGRWQEWLSVTSRGTDKDFPPMARAPLHRFVTPFERAFVRSSLPPSSAEFVQDPDVLPVESFLTTRPLGQLIHEVLEEAVRAWHEAVGGRRQILEVGARRVEESVRYRRAAEPDSYVLADLSRHFLDRAEEVVGDLFDFHQLGDSGAPDRCPPHASARAGLVICNQTLHQADDIDATLQDVWRLTMPGGTMLAVETTAMSPMADISAAFLAGEPHDLRAATGRMLLDAAEWDEALRRNGWTPMECIPIAASSILFIAKRTAAITPQRLPAREFEHVVGLLSSRLPEHMRPKQVFEIGCLPLTGNGKVDRKSLVAMVPEELDEGTDSPELPRTSTEERLIEIWDELLRTSSSVDADYFRLGGDSLTATKLRRAIEERFDVEFPLDGIFDAPRLRDMAERIDEAAARSSNRTALPPMIHGVDQFAPFPLTEVQQSYLIGSSGGIELGEVSSHCYFEMATPVLDPRRVEASFNALIQRHPMLRTVVCDDALHQRVLPDVPQYVMPHFESPKLTSDALVEEIRDEMSRQRFDPKQWPCFDIRLVSDGEGGRLFLSFDNLFVDGWSMFHLFREWKQAYEHGASSLTDPLPYSFKDYVETSTEWARSELHARDLAYWESSLETIRPAPQLPISGVEAMGSSEFVRYEALLPEDTWRKVKEHVQGHGLTEAVFIAEVYAEVLARHSEEPGLSINLTRFDRTRFAPEVDTIVGDFTSLSILSVDTDCAATFRDRAAALQRRMVSNLEHGSVTGVAGREC